MNRWWLAAFPILPFLLVGWTWRLPTDERVMTLAGSEWVARVVGSSEWKPFRVPGNFAEQGVDGADVEVKRTVTLPASLRGQALMLQVGAVRSAAARIFIDGTPIGEKGALDTGFVGQEQSTDEYFVPASLTTAGSFEVLVRVHSLLRGDDGLIDSRMVLGPWTMLKPWAFQQHAVQDTLSYGGLALLVGLLVVVALLWLAERGHRDVRLYGPTALMLLSGIGYVAALKGLFISSVFSPSASLLVLLSAVVFIGLATCEFVEEFYLHRATPLRWLNRAVTFIALALMPFFPSDVFRFHSTWLFLLIVEGAVLAVRDLLTQRRENGGVVASAMALVILTGVNDLVSDLDLFYGPRLFGLGISEFAILSGVVVVAEFVRLAADNRRLAHSLEARNDELKVALVRAEEGSRVKSEFLSSTSHELRTPLNAIINVPQGMLEALEPVRQVVCRQCAARFDLEAGETVDEKTACPGCGALGGLELQVVEGAGLAPDESRRLLGSVVASGKHLLAVVNDILDFSKLEAGRMTLARERVSIDTLLDNLELSMRPMATRSGVTLSIARSGGVEWSLDPVRLQQVLVNLVGNAIKFSDGKGTVWVTVSSSETTLELAVRDEGVGIRAEDQQLIFEGFRQAEAGHTRRFGGTGLGLSITKKLVELHGGRVAVASTVGQGSTFTVTLPRGDA